MSDTTPGPSAASDSCRIMLAFVARWQMLVLSAGDGDAGALVGAARDIIGELPHTITKADRAIVERVLGEFVVRLAQRAGGRRQELVSQCLLDFIGLARTPACWTGKVLAFLDRCAGAFQSVETPTPQPPPPLVRQALQTIHARYAEPLLRLSDVARESDVSTWHLSRVLTVSTGKGFLDHLHARRTLVAFERLTTSSANVQQTATAVGYSTVAQLRRHFVRRYRMTLASVRRGARARSIPPSRPPGVVAVKKQKLSPK